MNALREKTDERRLAEASAWRTYFTENDLDSTVEFEAWLAQDAKNQNAWTHVQSSWEFFGEQATAPELLDLRRRALGGAHSAGRQRWARGYLAEHWKRWGVAAAVIVVALTGVLVWNLSSGEIYRTHTGERRQVTLTDGSRVELDAASELRVNYSDRARELTLKQGQARFDVAHDVQRPFSVLAGGRKVVALGTAFNVDLLGHNLFVTLIEGKVAILSPDSATTGDRREDQSPDSSTHLPAAGERGTTKWGVREKDERSESNSNPAKLRQEMRNAKNREIFLSPGEQLSVSSSGTAIVQVANVQRATAWQNGQVIFDDEPLASVVTRMNRYAAKSLTVSDDAAQLKLSGVFDLNDVDGFVTTVSAYLPIESEVSAGDIRLRHR